MDKPKSGVLKEIMIFQKTRTQNLADVRTLNMWGYELEDVSIISKLINAETISLPINKIKTLAPFKTCKNLKNLLLRQNQISDISEIQFLAGLPNLKNLTLADNPIASLPNYRETVINTIPQLEKLDDIEVTELPIQPSYQNPNPKQLPRQHNAYNENVNINNANMNFPFFTLSIGKNSRMEKYEMYRTIIPNPLSVSAGSNHLEVV